MCVMPLAGKEWTQIHRVINENECPSDSILLLHLPIVQGHGLLEGQPAARVLGSQREAGRHQSPNRRMLLAQDRDVQHL